MCGETPTEALTRVAAAHPGRAAIEWGPRTVTYGDLESAVDRLAGFLADAVPTRGSAAVAARIGVRATELPAMATALLAVARCGLVCVPLDPTAPPHRLASIISDVEAALVLTDDPAQLAGLAAAAFPPVVSIAAAVRAGRRYGAPALVASDDVVSIIFTSGSAGRPKGVMSPRRVLVDSVRRNRAIGLTPGPRRFGVPIVGTAGNFERLMLSAAIADGATIVGYDVRSQGVAPLAEWLQTQRIEHFGIVPTLLRAMLEAVAPGEVFAQLHTVFTWGESVSWLDAQRLLGHLPPVAKLLVTYRSTEASGIAYTAVGAQTEIGTGNVPAGLPMPGITVRVVDAEGIDVAAGDEGHIVVGPGDLTAGYWRRPAETAEAFRTGADGVRSCWTGDVGWLTADGRLVATGRADQMVKVSGNRVDLGEIEAALRALEGVAQAAVVGRSDEAGDLRLHAFVTGKGELAGDRLRCVLRSLLPSYMVPDSVEVIAQLPTLTNGKLDRRALRTRPPAQAGPVSESDAPRDDLERALVGIWRGVLGVAVSRSARFTDLGGDSLRAARMFARVQADLGYDRPVSLLLEAPTVALLAAALRDDDGANAWSPLVLVGAGGNEPPLFIVHGAGGDVMFAALVAGHLDQSRPVYGLRPSVLSGRPMQEQTIEELATTYLAAMRRVQGNGPYALFGYSLGARVAFEIAHQLLAAGDQVSLLALGDMAAPGFDIGAALPSTTIRWRRRIAEQRSTGAGSSRVYRTLTTRLVRRTLRRWHQHATGAASKRRIAAAMRLGKAVPPALRNDFAVSQLRVLSRRYAPEPLDVPLLLIRTDQVPDVPDLGWGPLARDLRIEHVHCVHLDLIREPHVKSLAEVLDRYLRLALDDAAFPL